MGNKNGERAGKEAVEHFRLSLDACEEFLERLFVYCEHLDGCPGGDKCTCGLEDLLSEGDKRFLAEGLKRRGG